MWVILLLFCYCIDNLAVKKGFSYIDKSCEWFTLCKIITFTDNNDCVFGPTGILTIGFTRGNVVGYATFALSCSHSRDVSITQIAGCNYYQFDLRFYLNYGNSLVITINDNYTKNMPFLGKMRVYFSFINTCPKDIYLFEEYDCDQSAVSSDHELLKFITTREMVTKS